MTEPPLQHPETTPDASARKACLRLIDLQNSSSSSGRLEFLRPPSKLTLLGTGTIIPHPERGQSGLLLQTGGGGPSLLFDCGSGTGDRLARSGVDPTTIDHIIITHHHIDHDSGIMPLLKGIWLAGKKEASIIGPQGTAAWLEALLTVWPYMKGRMEINVTEMAPGRELWFGDLELCCQPMVHAVPCLGYRLNFPDGRSFVYTGDTEPCQGMADLLGQGATVLVQECALPETLKVTNHTTPGTLARFLREQKEKGEFNLKTLVLTHFYQENLGREEKIREILCPVLEGTELFLGQDLDELGF